MVHPPSAAPKATGVQINDMSDATKAVFLSYAREDAGAAKRIADALRGFGVEVWFDMSELRGGDQWDVKIRGQIKACTLFIPIISQTTQSRDEAYFRLEWKLADDRSHLMVSGKAFIMPVVIDGTAESGAAVPDSISRAQWTRLPGGAPTTEFIEQVKRLLVGKAVAGVADPGSATPATTKSIPGWTWGVLTAVVVGIVVALSVSRKPEPAPAAAVIVPPPASNLPSPSRPPAADAKSIAVLPFANLSTDKENEFFADGVHDDVITNLAKIRDLKVISRTSVLAYRDLASRNLKKIAAELGVSSILEGSIRRVGNQVHMNAQLIDARTDEHLWAETYDGDTGDIFALQAKLAQKIAAALKATLTPGERTLIERRPTTDQAAYELFLRGRVLEQGLTPSVSREPYKPIILLYEQAIARDPDFALAHVHLSIVHGMMYWFGNVDPTPERRALAQASLAAAQRLAPDAPETRYAQGSFAYLCENDWSKALEEYRAAEAGLPNDAQLHFRIGLTLRRLGRVSESLSRFAQSVSLNPNDLSPTDTQIQTLQLLHRYPQALELYARYQLMAPAIRIQQESLARTQYALTGDRAAYLRARAAMTPSTNESDQLEDRYLLAFTAGDLVAVARVLADPRLTAITSDNGAIKDPVSLHRAGIALLQGDADAAKRHAEAAVIAYQTGHWTPRQEPLVRLGAARAQVWADPTEENVRNLQARLHELAKRDKFLAFSSMTEVARTLAPVGRREEALAILRELLAGPSIESPNELRDDPFLASLKKDPRFEEILKSAKPL